ncbi:transmembrane protein [Pelomyxa schiedti]|nr:transmembrane protein [Pelomyxa schiedti]
MMMTTAAADDDVPDPNTTSPTDYPMDTAKVRLYVMGSAVTSYNYVSDECYHCLETTLMHRAQPETEYYFDPVDTRWGINITVYRYNGSFQNSIKYHFAERGVYTLLVNSNTTPWDLSITEDAEPQMTWLPEVVFILGLLFLFILWQAFKIFLYWRKRWKHAPLTDSITEHPAAERIGSVDTFRGISLVIMIFVNSSGGGYWYFNHATWNGLTVADLVFPWFVFLMGTSMALSFKRRKGSNWEIFKKIFIRSLKLFCLGLFLNNGWNYKHWRIPGVLQRFGLSYFFVACLAAYVPAIPLCNKKIKGDPLVGEDSHKLLDLQQSGRMAISYMGKAVSDIVPYFLQWLIILACVAVCTCRAYDPEGLLGYLTSFFMCYLGLQAGRILTHHKQHAQRLVRWLLWGLILGSIAAGLCLFEKEGGPIPINKNLWSLSFVLALAGGGNICLSLCYIVEDVWKVWEGEPFLFMGMNSISMYCLSEVFGGYFPFSFQLPADTHWWLLSSNVLGVSVWVLVSYLMWREKLFISL